MKVQKNKNLKTQGFTLIEMIGVLAVIAILAALLIPKIFNAINDARVNNAVVSYNTIKAASAEHYAKFGAFDKTSGGAAVPATPTSVPPPGGVAGMEYWDAQLLAEGFSDKLFLVKIGTNSFAKVTAGAGGPPLSFPVDSQYNLDGVGTNDVINGNWVVEAIIEGVAATDAKDVNDRLDGDTPPFVVVVGNADTLGRVKYNPAVKGGELRIYATHR